MNWGYKILIVYAVFFSGILFLVVKSSEQKVDMVTTDYYDKELKYQQQIDAMSNVDQLSDTVKYEMNGSNLAIIFPKDFLGKKVTGNAVLYCPSDEDKDMTHQFSSTDTTIFFPVRKTGRLEYELQLSWQSGGKNYYFKKKLLIN